MDLNEVLKKGVKVPDKILLPPSSFDPATGEMTLALGAVVSPGTTVKVYVETTVTEAQRKLAGGLVDVLNGVREQLSPDDETPGELTVKDLGDLLGGMFLGKQ